MVLIAPCETAERENGSGWLASNTGTSSRRLRSFVTAKVSSASASSAGGPSDRLAPAAPSSSRRRRACIAAASAPPVARWGGPAPGDGATEDGTSVMGISVSGRSSSSASSAAAAATACTPAADPPAVDSVNVIFDVCGNVLGMYEHITSAGVPDGANGNDGSAVGRASPERRKGSASSVFSVSKAAAAVSGMISMG